MSPNKYLRRKEAAQYLREGFGIGSAATLAKFATIGGGPVYRKIGRIPVYLVEDLDRWAAAGIGPAVQSTSEAREFNRAAAATASSEVA